MASYSVATTKDQLSSLIDKALAGEEVVIIRHGKPTVTFTAVRPATRRRISRQEAFEQLRQVRDPLPAASIPYLDLKRVEEEERPY